MVFSKGMNGEALTVEEVELFKTDPVSYTHLDVYKRQGRGSIRRIFRCRPLRHIAENGEDLQAKVTKNTQDITAAVNRVTA